MGRDILFDQNCRYNLAVRRTLEAITENYKGDRSSADYKAMEVYLKRVWFSNGIHHHYGEEKFVPGFSEEFFVSAVKGLDPNAVPVRDGQTVDQFLAELVPVIFDPSGTKQTDGAKRRSGPDSCFGQQLLRGWYNPARG
jgi:hypothetical protein